MKISPEKVIGLLLAAHKNGMGAHFPEAVFFIKPEGFVIMLPGAEPDVFLLPPDSGLFRSVAFPVGEFFPPNTVEMPKDYVSTRNYCACK